MFEFKVVIHTVSGSLVAHFFNAKAYGEVVLKAAELYAKVQQKTEDPTDDFFNDRIQVVEIIFSPDQMNIVIGKK